MPHLPEGRARRDLHADQEPFVHVRRESEERPEGGGSAVCGGRAHRRQRYPCGGSLPLQAHRPPENTRVAGGVGERDLDLHPHLRRLRSARLAAARVFLDSLSFSVALRPLAIALRARRSLNVFESLVGTLALAVASAVQASLGQVTVTVTLLPSFWVFLPESLPRGAIVSGPSGTKGELVTTAKPLWAGLASMLPAGSDRPHLEAVRPSLELPEGARRAAGCEGAAVDPALEARARLVGGEAEARRGVARRARGPPGDGRLRGRRVRSGHVEIEETSVQVRRMKLLNRLEEHARSVRGDL